MSEDPRVHEADLHAYADERLDAARQAEVEAWLSEHPDDAERVAEWKRLGQGMRELYDPVLGEKIPAALEHAGRGGLAQRAFARGVAIAASWLVVGAALGGLAGWQLRGAPLPAAPAEAIGMAKRAAVAHAVYSPEVRHPVEVGADQEQHLVSWLSKRLGVKVKAPKLDEAGMSLVGGRLLPGEVGPVAQFMYQSDRGRRMTLYLRAEPSPHRETAFRYARENNVGVFYWVERDCSYAIASGDLSKDELLKVASMVYKQLEP
jgi:anti-sigma factor RsiW